MKTKTDEIRNRILDSILFDIEYHERKLKEAQLKFELFKKRKNDH